MQDAAMALLRCVLRALDVLVRLYRKGAPSLRGIRPIGEGMAMHLPFGRGVSGQHS